MKVIDQINGSALFAQSAYSAAVATNDDLGRKISTTYLTAVDLSPYATTNELEQVSADITATIPSTAGLASESYVQTNSAVLTAMIAEKQDTLTFGYDEQDRINSINSSALAGGGDVPEDVMVETGLEYNAVGEISGYGSSAIAQYGAEKQWLVHDDTIVHIANSAQYAFGCNISALQRLMGIDETVLFDANGTTATSYSLSETFKNFYNFKVLFKYNDGYKVWSEFDGSTTTNNIPSPFLTTITGTSTYTKLARFSANDGGTEITRNATLEWVNFSNKLYGNNIVWVEKIVGIGRKQ